MRVFNTFTKQLCAFVNIKPVLPPGVACVSVCQSFKRRDGSGDIRPRRRSVSVFGIIPFMKKADEYNVRRRRNAQVETERRGTAKLSSDGPYTLFSFGGRRLKFRAPQCLRRYLRVKKWDDGYLEVDADYGKDVGVVEEYIDLRPVLRDLILNPRSFLSPIKRVEVSHA